MYPPRAISGFLKKDELELLHQRRTTRKLLDKVSVDEAIAGRFYQQRAIRRVGEAFEKDRQRKALLVMATGSGKTRTVIALIDQLMRANWVRRVLFLADRIALVKQAHGAFKAHLPATPSANLLERHDPSKNDHSGARVLLSTYPTMMVLIDETKGGEKRFGPGHFDLIVIDEAHRSVYRKYRAIFDYFDSFLVGLTATPRDEIDRDTYSLFQLERGVPTDAYDLDDAVSDGYLVPPRSISVPLKFQRDGIDYDDLSEEEKEEWDALEWDEEGTIPDRVEAADLNKWLFNKDTVDKVLEHLMRNGIKVAGGDRLGKTIIFAKNSKHAQFITERFDENYPHLKGEFARLIDYSVPYAQSLIDDFSEAEKEHAELLGVIKKRLHDEVLGMNLENFMVRHKRRAVENFQQEDSWAVLDLEARMTLKEEIAGLPTAYQDDPLPAKQFDLLVLNAKLLLLQGDAGFEKLQKRMVNVASALEALSNVPLVAKQMSLILDMQTDEFWVDITVEILEDIRRRLRGLVELIKPTERKVVITDFEDEIGDGAGIDLPNVGSGVDKGRFKMKVRRFIEDHRDHITLIKLRKAEPLTPQDLEELERFFLEQGIAAPEDLEAIKAEQGLGRFLRSLTGLDRAAAKEAFSDFTTEQQLTADQLEFVDRIIDALTETGFVDPKNFYESPYTDIDSQGIVGVFPKEQAKQIIEIVKGLNTVEAA